MKKTIYFILTILLLTTNYSCQEVVDIDLETAQERLVIEAMINWKKGTAGNEQNIKLSKTSSYYNNQILMATGASVKLTNKSTLESFDFIEGENGIYSTTTFIPILNDIYALEITYDGEVYKAEETLFEAPIIESVEQSEDGVSPPGGGPPEANISSVIVNFQDFIDQEDFYRITFQHYRPSTNELIETEKNTYDSRFEQNNLLTDFYASDEIEIDDVFNISVQKISKQFFTFITVLEAQSEGRNGPFSTPPVNVKGNCINTSNEAHYPYGYFGLTEASTANYTFVEN